MKGTHIGEFEELVLLSIGLLGNEAYGLAVMDDLEKRTRRRIMISSVHKVLVRLEEKGYVKSSMGGATQVRGGREKRIYTLTRAGVKVLEQTRALRESMWQELPKLAWK